MNRLLRKIWRAGRQALAPPPNLTVSQWAQQYRFLSPEASAEPGKWRNDRAPHLVDPMDALSPQDPCRTVVCKFSSQVGKTEVTLNFIGYIVSQDPGPTLAIQPNVKPMGESYSKDRVSPLIRDNPVVKKQVSQARGKASANTISHKSFPGGHLTVGGANSPSNLASRPIRFLIGDELDRWEVTKEGSPLSLARKRQTTFWNRKELLTSSPTYDNVGIDAEYSRSEQQYEWHLSCRSCGETQFPRFEHFQWDGDYRAAKYICKHCGSAHDLSDEDRIKATGRWVCKKSDGWRSKAYWMNQWGSPFVRWIDTLDEVLAAQQDKDELQVVVNTVFAETWKVGGDQLTEDDLINRVEPFDIEDIPEEIRFLTCGVDVQKDRLEAQIVGWDSRDAPFILDHRILIGPPNKPQVWKALTEVIQADYGGLKISITCVDRQYLTEYVDKYCRGKYGSVYPIRGEPGYTLSPINRPRKAGRPAIRYIPVGVDKYKDRIQAALAETGMIRFSDSLEQDWFDQLLSEEVRIKKLRGQSVREWVKIKKRNEALDCLVYAWAAKDLKSPSRAKPQKKKTKSSPPPINYRKNKQNFVKNW